ncbi:MAG: hypothetical protein IK123_06920 [Lachnospiraceae bacterium]|nr:hypothetical protein [Lachnospiraceae bacterium]
MFFAIVAIAIVIAIIALTVRYLYVQAHILSSKEFRKTAERQSFKMRAKDPKITCNYCGCIINTAKEKRCPNCGAVYGDDEEIKQRFDVDEADVEKRADAAADDAVARAHEKALESLHYIRIAIAALVCVFVLAVICAVIVDNVTYYPDSTQKYRGDGEVKDYGYNEYTLIDSPDVTILDEGGVTLRLVSVYANNRNYITSPEIQSYRVGFSLTNTRKEPVRLSLKCIGINGRCESGDYIYIYSHFKPSADVVFYESVYGEYFESIDEIVLGERSLSAEGVGNIYESKEMETFKFNENGYTLITDDADKGSVIFENDKIRIRSLEKGNGDRRYDIWIDNLSEHSFYVNTSDFKLNGTVPGQSYVLYNAGLPAGYTLHHDSVKFLGDNFENRPDDAVVELSFSFSDPVDPSNDFSTGYIELK